MYVNTDTPSVYTTPRLFCWLHSAEQHVNLCHTGSHPFSYNPFSNCEWNFISFVGPDWTKKPHFLCPELYLRGSTQNISTHTHTLWDTQCVCTAVENLHYHGGRLPSSTVTSNRVSLSQLCVCVCTRDRKSSSLWVCVRLNLCVCVLQSVYLIYCERGNTGQFFIWCFCASLPARVHMHACVHVLRCPWPWKNRVGPQLQELTVWFEKTVWLSSTGSSAEVKGGFTCSQSWGNPAD